MSEPLVRFGEVPEATSPSARVRTVVARDQRPIFVLDLSPYFRAEPCGADRAGLPCVARRHACAVRGGSTRVRELRAPLLEHSPPIPCRQALHGVNQRWQRGLAVGRDREIDLLHPPEVL